jgi:hypothetical protein
VVLVPLTYGDVWRGPLGPKLAAAGLCALLIALAPIPAGVLVIRRMARSGSFYGADGLWVVTGILGFFILLDALVGLGGRYDFTAGAVATTFALWWLHKRDRRAPT